MESQEKIRFKELEVRLAQERRPIIGQGDVRTDGYARIKDVQAPVYDKNTDDLDS